MTAITTCRLFLVGLLAAAGCVGGPAPITSNANSQVSTACKTAQDDCKAKFDAVAAEGTALTATCQTDVAQACKAGPSAACTAAQNHCASAVDKIEHDATNATTACESEVSMNCSPGGAGSGSGSSAGSGSGSGSGSGGLSAACKMAIDDCVNQTKTLLSGAVLPHCGTGLVTACMDPANLAACEASIADCTKDANDLVTKAGAVATKCEMEITAACK
jgi:hypothetical protein